MSNPWQSNVRSRSEAWAAGLGGVEPPPLPALAFSTSLVTVFPPSFLEWDMGG